MLRGSFLSYIAYDLSIILHDKAELIGFYRKASTALNYLPRPQRAISQKADFMFTESNLFSPESLCHQAQHLLLRPRKVITVLVRTDRRDCSYRPVCTSHDAPFRVIYKPFAKRFHAYKAFKYVVELGGLSLEMVNYRSTSPLILRGCHRYSEHPRVRHNLSNDDNDRDYRYKPV